MIRNVSGVCLSPLFLLFSHLVFSVEITLFSTEADDLRTTEMTQYHCKEPYTHEIIRAKTEDGMSFVGFSLGM